MHVQKTLGPAVRQTIRLKHGATDSNFCEGMGAAACLEAGRGSAPRTGLTVADRYDAAVDGAV
jgi:hypothetical protein